MAASSPSLSLHSASSLSPSSSSSSSLSSLYSKTAPSGAHRLPRRGQIKAAIFASLFASIAELLGARAADESENGAANSQDGERSSRCRSVDLEGRDLGHSGRSSSVSNVSGREGFGSASPAESRFFSTLLDAPATEMRTVNG